MPLIASHHPSSCHAWACPYFNVSCQSLPVCVCVCFFSFPWMCVCQFPLWLRSLFWHVIWCKQLYASTWHTLMVCSHVWVWVRVQRCWDQSRADGLFGLRDDVLLCIIHIGLAHTCKNLSVVNPITFSPSTSLITAVENRLRWIRLRRFCCQSSWIPVKETQIQWFALSVFQFCLVVCLKYLDILATYLRIYKHCPCILPLTSHLRSVLLQAFSH